MVLLKRLLCLLCYVVFSCFCVCVPFSSKYVVYLFFFTCFCSIISSVRSPLFAQTLNVPAGKGRPGTATEVYTRCVQSVARAVRSQLFFGWGEEY